MVDKCSYCYTFGSNLRPLNREDIVDPWDHLPEVGKYCKECYERFSFQGIVLRYKYRDEGFERIDEAIASRTPFLYDVSRHSGCKDDDLDKVLKRYPGVDDTLFVIDNLYQWGYTNFSSLFRGEPSADDQLKITKVLIKISELDGRLFNLLLARQLPSEVFDFDESDNSGEREYWLPIFNAVSDKIEYKYFAVTDLINFLEVNGRTRSEKYNKRSLEIWEEWAEGDPRMIPQIRELRDLIKDSTDVGDVSNFWFDQTEVDPRFLW